MAEKIVIGSFLTVLRKAKGLTQQDLAERLGVSNKAISRWERDESLPDLSLLPPMAEILGVTCDEILRGTRNTAGTTMDKALSGTTRQVEHLCDAQLLKYRIVFLSCLAGCIAGALLDLALSFTYETYTLAFFAGFLFCAASCVVAAGFYLRVRHTFSGPMIHYLDDFSKQSYLKKLQKQFFAVLYAAVLALASGLPYFFTPRTFLWKSWLLLAAGWMAAAALLCFAATLFYRIFTTRQQKKRTAHPD